LSMTTCDSSTKSTPRTLGLTPKTIHGGEYATAASTTTLGQNRSVTQHQTRLTRTGTGGLRPFGPEKAHGLLAYVDGKIVGWCNAGPRTSYRNLHNLVPAGESPGEVGSILCFVVAAPFRGKGVCTSLLHTACDKLRDDGLEVAEGYPSTLPPDVNNPYNTPTENQNYRGPLRMFLKSGFAVHQQLERHAIVRKPLGP